MSRKANPTIIGGFVLGAIALVVVALAWAPFVIADPGTLSATQFTIVNEPSSALRALGVSTPGTPSWDRPAQVLVGCALGVLAIRRRECIRQPHRLRNDPAHTGTVVRSQGL